MITILRVHTILILPDAKLVQQQKRKYDIYHVT